MPLTEERATRILLEETISRRPATPDGDEEEASYRRSVRRDVKMLREAGVEVVIPADNPDPGEPESSVA